MASEITTLLQIAMDQHTQARLCWNIVRQEDQMAADATDPQKIEFHRHESGTYSESALRASEAAEDCLAALLFALTDPELSRDRQLRQLSKAVEQLAKDYCKRSES